MPSRVETVVTLPIIPNDDSSFAAASRADAAEVGRQRARFMAEPFAMTMLEAMPGPAMVLNRQRQIVAVNTELTALLGVEGVDRLLGSRPGELVGCVHARERLGGCGTSEACATCGAVKSIVEAQRTRGRSVQECRIVTEGASEGGALDFRVFAHHLQSGEEHFVVLGLTDISSEKRRQVLERTFFHDLVNEVGGLRGLAEILAEDELDPTAASECKVDILRLSDRVLDEIQMHRQMLSAERGTLVARHEPLSARGVLDEVGRTYRHHPVAEGRSLVLAPGMDVRLESDPGLLRRVLGNLVKNAIEATPCGGTITVRCEPGDGAVTFVTHNPGVMPREVQLQVFQRSFSTKGGEGRGVGTYSVRLFAERYLGGRVGFTSDEARGTEFRVTLPVAAAASEGHERAA